MCLSAAGPESGEEAMHREGAHAAGTPDEGEGGPGTGQFTALSSRHYPQQQLTVIQQVLVCIFVC